MEIHYSMKNVAIREKEVIMLTNKHSRSNLYMFKCPNLATDEMVVIKKGSIQ